MPRSYKCSKTILCRRHSLRRLIAQFPQLSSPATSIDLSTSPDKPTFVLPWTLMSSHPNYYYFFFFLKFTRTPMVVRLRAVGRRDGRVCGGISTPLRECEGLKRAARVVYSFCRMKAGRSPGKTGKLRRFLAQLSWPQLSQHSDRPSQLFALQVCVKFNKRIPSLQLGWMDSCNCDRRRD
jgi:hypothetical protein